LPGGVHDADRAGRLVQRVEPAFGVLQRVPVVVGARQRAKAQRREERQAFASLVVIPADDDQVVGDEFPRAGKIAFDEIVVAVGVVMRIEHVRPDEHLGLRIDAPDNGHLSGDAIAQDLGHAQTSILARPAASAGPNLVHAEQVLRRA